MIYLFIAWISGWTTHSCKIWSNVWLIAVYCANHVQLCLPCQASTQLICMYVYCSNVSRTWIRQIRCSPNSQRVTWTVQSQFNISLGKKMISTKVFCLSMLIFIEFVTTERLVRTSVDSLDRLPSIVFAQ